jgi:hypothetical protein
MAKNEKLEGLVKKFAVGEREVDESQNGVGLCLGLEME